MSEDLRQRYIREISDELGKPVEEFGEYPEEADFDAVKARRLGEVEPGSAEAQALESITWDEVREYMFAL